jgi:phosphoadenosine phosphosulfate reductase
LRNPQPLRWNASKNEAEELNLRLVRVKNLADRIREMRRRIEGRIAFSTSLGWRTRQSCTPSPESGADIDVFTLDTGRLFPEVLETGRDFRNPLRHPHPLVAPEASEVEALVARDGVFGFKNSVENRKACCEVRKVRPLNRELKVRKAGSPASPRAFRREGCRAACRVGR